MGNLSTIYSGKEKDKDSKILTETDVFPNANIYGQRRKRNGSLQDSSYDETTSANSSSVIAKVTDSPNRSPLRQIFHRISRGKNYISLQDLREFLSFVQKEDLETFSELHFGSFQLRLTEAKCLGILRKYQTKESLLGKTNEVTNNMDETLNFVDNKEEENVTGLKMDFAGFVRMLIDRESNSVAFPKTSAVWQDMSRPLSEYFISSSHNTYLTGNQFNSDSSPQALRNALLLGVRNLELDCYDGEDGYPIVTHKPFAVTPCSFEDCIIAVNEYSHSASDYPVILTLENHCSLEQQKIQAKIMKEHFRDKLYVWKEFDASSSAESLQSGPITWKSPEDLRHKIILRDKPVRDLKKTDKRRLEKERLNAELKKQKGNEHVPLSLGVSSPNKSMTSNSNPSTTKPLGRDQSSLKGCHEELLALVYMKNIKLKKLKAGPFVSFVEPKSLSSSSINETKMLKYAKNTNTVASLRSYTRRHILRVYPKNTRLWSSNYDPLPAWNLGCQMVALNYQTFSEPVWLNHGLFSVNGCCGFVLKPKQLLDNSRQDLWYQNSNKKSAMQKLGLTFYSDLNPDVEHETPIFLRVRVISCHNIPDFRNTDPYVKVSLHTGIKGSSKVSKDIRFSYLDELVDDTDMGSYGVNKAWEGNGVDSNTESFLWERLRTKSLPAHESVGIRSNTKLNEPVFEMDNHQTTLQFEITRYVKKMSMLSFVIKRSNNPGNKGSLFDSIGDPGMPNDGPTSNFVSSRVIGQYCIPLAYIRQGYRVVPLNGPNCKMVDSFLLCYFELTRKSIKEKF